MIYVLIHEDKVTERALFVALYGLDNRCVHNFTISPPPLHLAFAFHPPPPPFIKIQYPTVVLGGRNVMLCLLRVQRLPWNLSGVRKPLPAALLTSGNLDVSQVVAPAAAD